MMRFQYFLIILLLFIFQRGFSQSSLGAWYIYNGSFFVKEKTELFFETQIRLREITSNKEEIFFRPIFIHHFNSKWNGGLGYTYHINFADASSGDNDKSSHENRIILQAQIYTPVEKTNIQHRLRLEQRWITSVSTSDTETRQRFRYRLQATVPLNSSKIGKGVFFVNVYNELFINLQDGLDFDQNRLYLAPGYQFSNSTNLQLGYLYQRKGEENLNRLQIFFTQKLYFYK